MPEWAVAPSVVTAPRPDRATTAPPMPRRLLFGWGRTTPSAALVTAPSFPTVVSSLLERASVTEPRPAGVVARGMGRSYGDAAQCAGGLVIETKHLDTIGPIDPETGSVEVGAGVSLDALLRTGLPTGWFLPVSPGTRQVSVGGAIAADVHGKNHHRDGSFGVHVSSLTLATPTGTHLVGPDADRELFWATAGGMGLTGVVTDAVVRMRKVETAWMRVTTEQHRNLESLMAGLERADAAYGYSVAWVDCAARGPALGRGLLDAGDHARLRDLPPRRRANPLVPPRPALVGMPVVAPSRLVNPLTVAAFNEAWFRKSPSREGQIRHLAGFFHPLDALRDWNRLYGRRGFVQYQFVVGDEHRDVVRRSIELLRGIDAPSSLAVLKRFGPGDPGPLSFPMPGWTLALDLAVGPPGLPGALRRLDELVAEAGGRVYLAKDARLAPATFRAMYPRHAELSAVRRRVDPEGILQSDLARRLQICEDAPA
jgi:decaprenylphospho-beta-D-ribofuranose 2-oxidase